MCFFRIVFFGVREKSVSLYKNKQYILLKWNSKFQVQHFTAA